MPYYFTQPPIYPCVPSIFSPTQPSQNNFYPGINFSNTAVPRQTQTINFYQAATENAAAQFAKEKFNIQNFDMDGDLDTANIVNETLTEIYNQYKGNLPMPATIVNFNKDKHGAGDSRFDKNTDGFYAAKFKYLALISGEQKLEQVMKEIDTQSNEGAGNFATWYKNGLKGDFSQVEFVDPKFQKEVLTDLKEYRKNPTKYDVNAKRDLGIKLMKLHATNQILSHRPIEAIEHLYNKPENAGIINQGGFKSLSEISQMSPAEQKQEFYDILDKLKSKNGNVYVDVDAMYKMNRKYNLLHEFGHFMHHTTKLQNTFNSFDKMVSFTEQDKQTAALVSKRAQVNPSEFVAEVFAGIMSGAKYPASVMALYQRFNGPQLPV